MVDEANQKMVTAIPERIAFRYESAVLNRDILSDYERAQSVSFVTRFDHLPTNLETHFTVDDKGEWRIANLWDLRQALNDFRPIIQNQSDSVHYQNVHNAWYQALRQTDKSKGTVVRVFDVEQSDVTDAYTKRLGERNQAIRHLIGSFDYDYLYNGFLQHSDPEIFKEIVSGLRVGRNQLSAMEACTASGRSDRAFAAILHAHEIPHVPQLGATLKIFLTLRIQRAGVSEV